MKSSTARPLRKLWPDMPEAFTPTAAMTCADNASIARKDLESVLRQLLAQIGVKVDRPRRLCCLSLPLAIKGRHLWP